MFIMKRFGLVKTRKEKGKSNEQKVEKSREKHDIFIPSRRDLLAAHDKKIDSARNGKGNI